MTRKSRKRVFESNTISSRGGGKPRTSKIVTIGRDIVVGVQWVAVGFGCTKDAPVKSGSRRAPVVRRRRKGKRDDRYTHARRDSGRRPLARKRRPAAIDHRARRLRILTIPPPPPPRRPTGRPKHADAPDAAGHGPRPRRTAIGPVAYRWAWAWTPPPRLDRGDGAARLLRRKGARAAAASKRHPRT